MLHKITRVTRPNGQPATDSDSLKRVGREGCILQLDIGYPMMLAYAEPDTGLLMTSPVVKIRSRPDRTLQINTQRHNYYLREVDAGSEEQKEAAPGGNDTKDGRQ